MANARHRRAERTRPRAGHGKPAGADTRFGNRGNDHDFAFAPRRRLVALRPLRPLSLRHPGLSDTRRISAATLDRRAGVSAYAYSAGMVLAVNQQRKDHDECRSEHFACAPTAQSHQTRGLGFDGDSYARPGRLFPVAVSLGRTPTRLRVRVALSFEGTGRRLADESASGLSQGRAGPRRLHTGLLVWTAPGPRVIALRPSYRRRTCAGGRGRYQHRGFVRRLPRDHQADKLSGLCCSALEH